MTTESPAARSTGSTSASTARDTESAADRAAKVRFRRAMSFMVMTLVAPGSAQLAAGNRRVGAIALRIWIGLWVVLVGTVVAVLVHRELLYWIVADTALLLWVRLALFAGAIGWALLFMDAWRIGRPLSYGLQHRRVAVGVNGVLCLSVAGMLLFGAHLVGVQRDFIITTFGDGEVVGAHDGRYNVLLLGGDSGEGRWGLRPDSITVASIDAETGRTVLIGLPRNMANFPFAPGSVMDEQFPDGFDCDDCYLNGVSTWAGDNTELFPGSEHPGTDATVMAVEGITGLEINYWAMVNLKGFKDLVDAVGGVELNVREPIPYGGLGSDVKGYLETGTRKLNGWEALWYARSRSDSDDYSRMARQKCVMNALLDQVSPQNALRNFEKIARASSAMISTSLPASEVDRFLDLSLKAKGQQLSSLSLVPPLVNTSNPDIDQVHAKVQAAIDKAEGKAPKPGKRKVRVDAPVTGGSVGNLKDGYAANQAEDVAAVC